jgi:alpha-galactosidase
MWRVTGDVFDTWPNIIPPGWREYAVGADNLIDVAAELAEFGGPGHWNDLDMLVVGLKGKGYVSGGGMSFLEDQTHMSVSCMACSPLMIGCDVRNLDSATAGLLMNREVLAINQDPLGMPARRVRQIGLCELWRKPLADGSVVAGMINRGSYGADIRVKAKDIGMLDAVKHARNLWKQADADDFGAEITQHVQPHETVLLKVTP